eukprot:scaffold5159_cov112-Cylindrotheca_fusiformis.AAC.19
MADSIDFAKLLREEKRKARQLRNQQKKEESSGASSSLTKPQLAQTRQVLPPWNSSGTYLSFSELDLQLVSSDPNSIYYSPKCLNDTNALETWLRNLPSGDSGLGEWKTMKFGKRRVAMFGESEDTPLVGPLKEISRLLVEQGIFPSDEKPNHVLLNEYEPGQGILPHTDGPTYASRTATISLTSSVILEFAERLSSDEIGQREKDIKRVQVLLEPGSLIVFEDEA